MTIKESLEELNKIVANLDSSELSLEESIELYKKGIDLSASCRKKLDDAQLKITEYKSKESGEI